jgi:hypothetical protein
MTYRTFTTRSRSNPARLAGVALAAALAIALAGCSGGKSTPGTETRAVADFHGVELRGAADISVEVGPAFSVSITASPAALPRVKTEVSRGRLIIDHKRGWFWSDRGPLTVRITMPVLDEFEVNGAGKVNLNGVKGEKLELSIDGAANLTASGTITKLEADINGAGDMALAGLIATDAELTVNGAGKIAAQVTGTLEAEVNGVGNIRYSGNPAHVTTSINGVGSITPADAQNPPPPATPEVERPDPVTQV